MNFIKTGQLDVNYGRTFSRLFEMRQSGDYDDMFDLTSDDVVPYIEPTKNLIDAVKELIG